MFKKSKSIKSHLDSTIQSIDFPEGWVGISRQVWTNLINQDSKSDANIISLNIRKLIVLLKFKVSDSHFDRKEKEVEVIKWTWTTRSVMITGIF